MARLIVDGKGQLEGTEKEMYLEAASIAANFKKCNEFVKIQIEMDDGTLEDF